MAGFAQPDEGYSEDPLTAPSASAALSVKSREDAIAALGSSRSGDEALPWLIQHISGLSTSRKIGKLRRCFLHRRPLCLPLIRSSAARLFHSDADCSGVPDLAMAILDELPTAVISDIVNQLYPRLYINFVRQLPPEVCLKILSYLDPVSLINVARCCREWYNLAVDRTLWERLYRMEGWKALHGEIAAAEQEVNSTSPANNGAVRRPPSFDDGHAHKKRAIAAPPTLDADMDMVMVDAGSSTRQELTTTTSIFGDPRGAAPRNAVSHGSGNPHAHAAYVSGSSGSKGKSVDKGKGKAVSPDYHGPAHDSDTAMQAATAPRRLDKSTLWVWDASSRQFRINWKHLYSMRARLEANWERGVCTNFQFPHPDYPEEGHGECVYSLQYNSKYLVSGSRDRTLKIWDLKTRRCLRTLVKHRGSVLCLQFDSDPEEDLIVSGSSDSDVVIWRFSTGKEIQTLKHAHRESVLNVKFDKRILVTCSKDKTIKVFNRKPLRPGDLGYPGVDPVPNTVTDYGYNLPMSLDHSEYLPEVPAWTMIGCLEGHNAAVNAVQIHEREVVSASGDRHVKIWDWPTQVCLRTIVAHNKGIACVQYDGRRIVSGSSDNEVKVFDRQTGLEVANLRSHTSLVRTVQAGFGDLPYSVEEDLAEAKRVDLEYFKAVESGLLQTGGRPSRHRPANAGSRRPQDICAYGAKLPPGGGGGKYGRIVSGSYDASIIIWRRDKEGVWRDQHRFLQEDAALAAMRQERTRPPARGTASRSTRDMPASVEARTSYSATPPAHASAQTAATDSHARSQTGSAMPGAMAGSTLPPVSTLTAHLNQAEALQHSSRAPPQPPQHIHQIIDDAVQGGPQALAQAITTHPAILTYRVHAEAAIERVESPAARSQLWQIFSGALVRSQFEQARQRREALRNQDVTTSGLAPAAAAESSSQGAAGPANAAGSGSQLTPAQLAAAAAHQAHALGRPGGSSVQQVFPSTPAPAPTAVPAFAARPSRAPAPGQTQPHAHIQQPPMEVHETANAARVFKLQYDARRIICCSQRSVIVGWDFCNGDPELEEASRFFGPVD